MLLLVALAVGAAVEGTGRDGATLEGHGDLAAHVQSVCYSLLTVLDHELLDALVPLAFVEKNNRVVAAAHVGIKIALDQVGGEGPAEATPQALEIKKPSNFPFPRKLVLVVGDD